jgi:hypothetical protein
MADTKEMFGLILIMPWIIGQSLAVPYYNYLYFMEHGFISWLFFGQIVASIQSMFWPFELFGYLFG